MNDKRSKKTNARRLQVMNAALQCFNEQGITETSIAHICNTSGTSVGSLYHHFQSKEGLAAALYLDGIRNYQQGLMMKLKVSLNLAQGISAMIKHHIFWVMKNREWAVYLSRNRHASFMVDKDDEMLAMNKEFYNTIAQWMRPEVNIGATSEMSPDIFISVILGPCQEYTRLYLDNKAVTKPKEAVRLLTEAALRSCKLTE